MDDTMATASVSTAAAGGVPGGSTPAAAHPRAALATRKRTGGTLATVPAAAPPPSAPKRVVANPFPTANRNGTCRAGYFPRSWAALSRSIARRVFPRKFTRTRWSRARVLAAIVFAITSAFLLSKERLRRQQPYLPGVFSVGRSAMGAIKETLGQAAEPGRAALDGRDGRLEHVPQVETARAEEGTSHESNLSAAGAAQAASKGPPPGEDNRAPHDRDGDPQPREREESERSRGLAPSAQPSAEITAAIQVQESLRKDINAELAEVGETGIAESHVTAHHASAAATHHKRVSDGKGYASLLHRQSLQWDSQFLTSDNPWIEFSGSRGAYPPPASTSHVPPSAELWAHRDVRATAGFKFPFCRLYGACRSKSGRILLAKALEGHKSQLARCGVLSQANFVLGDRDAEAQYQYVSEVDGARTEDMDLVERHAPRRGAAHFLADSLKLLFFLDVVHGAGLSSPELMHRQCLDSLGERNGPCSFESPSDVRPVMLIRKESFVDDLWVPHYLKMLASRGTVNGHTPLRFLNQYSMYTGSKAGAPEPAVCFRSITTSAYMYGQIPPSALTSANPFFPGNGINRHPITPLRVEPDGLASHPPTCRLRVKISDHMTGEASDDLSTIAELLRERTAAAGHDNRASLTVVVPATERVRFSKQIERMQETDILVAPHGSPLTDTLFMRPGAAVIEIHPFSYQSGMFQGIAHQLGLGHAKLSAEPDVKMFDACISRYNNKTGTAGVSAVVERLQLAADEYKLTGKATLHLEDGGRDFQDVHEIKQCARRQRLRIDSSRLADEIWRSAQHICSLPAAAVPGGRGESSPSTPHPVQNSVTR